ncbi:MAG: hypothetical protein CMH48_05815 [Muricauda sp.]|nr:hypothetical protein [Allomuricauda sp.]MAU25907.1 hypothetical protein [Allomuricauda sp.]MBC30343.1 hypothetical protein [Allomuricauda sp.]|tara:strand:- start:672 stop:1037 length:366 start_codon:yes stop_codon:yes gene_type:complete
MNTLAIFEPRLKAVLEAFGEALIASDLSYSLDKLRRYGFSGDQELSLAVKRALQICATLGLDTRKHFRYIYIVDLAERCVYREWRASKFGFYLVLCNGNPKNPFVGALQMEMLKEFISNLE